MENNTVICPQMYFNSTLTDSSKLLKPLLVFSFTICAIICGLTRIIQYKNHAIDVYLGFLLGGAIAVYLVGASPIKCFLPNGFSKQKPHFITLKIKYKLKYSKMVQQRTHKISSTIHIQCTIHNVSSVARACMQSEIFSQVRRPAPAPLHRYTAPPAPCPT